MATIILGNVSAVDHVKPDPASDLTVVVPYEGRYTTVYSFPPDCSAGEVLGLLGHPTQGFIGRHSTEPPAWVDSPDRPELARVLAEDWGCVVGRPEDWVDDQREGREEATAAALAAYRQNRADTATGAAVN